MTNRSSCRLCGSERTSRCLELKRVPRNIQRLLKKDELDRDMPVRLDVLQCAQCGFVQFPPILGNDYYDDYLSTVSHSPQMQSFQQGQASDFIGRFGLAGQTVIEVGCGDGNYLQHLRNAGAVVRGIEPSVTVSRLATAKGFNVESGYVTATRRLNGGPFDGFVTRQVLEHVPEIHDFLQGIRLNLKPGAYGLVEVPSLEKALADRRFYDFFPDHVNYFSQRTLRAALELNGFEVVQTSSGMFDEYNIAIVRAPVTDDMASLQTTVDTLSREIERFIGDCKARGGSVAIWGAGGKGLSVMSAADVSRVDLLVDGDPHKRGLYSPLSHLQVQSPDALQDQHMDAIIVTAMAYRNEILDTLQNKLHFKGQIALLGHSLEIVK